jgi:hypothetical protein
LLLCTSNVSWTANERFDSSAEVSFCNQSEPSSQFTSCNRQEIGDGVLSSSTKESNIFPDVKKNLFSDYQIIDEIKSNGFYFADADLLFLIRKDNIFLSTLRI